MFLLESVNLSQTQIPAGYLDDTMGSVHISYAQEACPKSSNDIPFKAPSLPKLDLETDSEQLAKYPRPRCDSGFIADVPLLLLDADSTIVPNDESEIESETEMTHDISHRQSRKAFAAPKQIRYPGNHASFDDLLMVHLETVLERLALEHEQTTLGMPQLSMATSTSAISFPLPPDYVDAPLFQEESWNVDTRIFRRSCIESPDQVAKAVKSLRRKSAYAMLTRHERVSSSELWSLKPQQSRPKSCLLIAPPALAQATWNKDIRSSRLKQKRRWKWWLRHSCVLSHSDHDSHQSSRIPIKQKMSQIKQVVTQALTLVPNFIQSGLFLESLSDTEDLNSIILRLHLVNVVHI